MPVYNSFYVPIYSIPGTLFLPHDDGGGKGSEGAPFTPIHWKSFIFREINIFTFPGLKTAPFDP